MNAISETRRDLSSQIHNFSPNLLNNNSNTSAKNRGGGDGLSPLNNRPTMIPIVEQTSCRNTSNYFHAERNDSVCHLWRQHTQSGINQRINSASRGNQLLPISSSQQSQAQHQQQNCGGPNNLINFEQNHQLYSNFLETNSACNRHTQLLNNTLHVEQNRRNYLPNADAHNLLQQQPPVMDQTLYLNYTPNNLSQYPNPNGTNTNNSISPYLTIPQPYNYQNISTPAHNNNNPTQQPLNYPMQPPISSPPLVFGPPPRENRRPNINPQVFNPTTNPTYFHETSQSIPINSLFQSFSNHLIPEQIALNRLAMLAQGNNSNIVNKSHQNTDQCDNIQLPPPISPKSCYMLPSTTDRNGDILPDYIAEETSQIYSERSNMKLKFSKNVVNIPKKIEKNDSEQSNLLKTCISDLNISNIIKQTSEQNSEEIFNCQIRNCNTITKEDTYNTACQTIPPEDYQENRHSSPFVLQEESAFIDMIVEGCIHGEEIATKYQNVPCFKNIKKLCEKTKSDLMTPHCTARNIHSQGIPWATKDYIFAFTRLTSCWYLLKGYLGQKSDVFDKIEQLYSSDLRQSFELWEQTTMNLTFHIMKSFIALGNNSTTKWNPNAHSTPVITKDTIRKKCVSAFPSLIDLDDSKNKTFDKSTGYSHNHNIVKSINGHYDFDSGDENSSKKYIKPGSYSVPQIRNPNMVSTSTANPKSTTFNGFDSNTKKISPIMILTHRNEQTQSKIDETKNNDEYIPFKKTPQGILTSALMKKSRCEDYPKDENEYSLQSKMLFDALKIKKPVDNKQEIESNDKSTNLIVERSVEVNDVKCNEYQVKDGSTCKDDTNSNNVSTFIENTSSKSISTTLPNNIYGTNKEYCESKSSIRKGVVTTNKSRRSSYSTSDYQTKSVCNKTKTHKSFYNTIVPKYFDDNNCNNMKKMRSKCRQNVKWNIWYSRKHDGLSNLAIEIFERILHELWNMPSSHYFVFEVDVRDIPDYYDIIKEPIFLTNILQKLKQYKYNNLNQVVHDFRRIFKNARIFLEVHPDKRLQRLIGHFSNTFEQLLNDNFPKIDFSTINNEENEFLPETNLLSKNNNESSGSSEISKSDDNITSPSSQEDR